MLSFLVANSILYHKMLNFTDPENESLLRKKANTLVIRQIPKTELRFHLQVLLTTKVSLNPFPNDNILQRSKLKEFVDDNFEFDENRRKFSKQVENTVGKGEIARYEQFLLCPQCFQKTCIADT